MADDQVSNAGGCLGRVLSWLGSLWILLIILAGVGAFRGAGPIEDLVGGIGQSLIPALLLVAGGRALRKRASRAEEPDAGAPAQPRPTPPVLAPPRPRKPVPTSPAAPPPPRPLIQPSEQESGEPEGSDTAGPEFDAASPAMFDIDFGVEAGGPPKSSKEMIEEAKRRLREL